jgi:diguanylate cyclase (GGDEF)-like protein
MKTTPQAKPPCRLLLVDDERVVHDVVAYMLRSDHIKVLSAINGDQAVEIARREPPDLILMDYEMPGESGLEVLARLRGDGISESVPVIFITGHDTHALLSACFAAGAADYIRKPLGEDELRARVQSALDRKRMVAQFERMALNDALTGLANRTAIRNRIQSTIDRNQNRNCAVLFLDFDRFKLVNDSLGHDVGDQLLQQIANRLRAALHRDDGVANSFRTQAARLGGDEFVVFLECLSDPQEALRVADRLLTSLAETYCLAGHEVCCTASIGVVPSLEAYVTPDEVLRNADTAMYEAKSAGKGRYVVFDQAMHERAEQRLRIESDLRGAITREELFLVYQPIVSLETGRTIGFEALVRWRHPQRGLLKPDEFLSSAEESGLIVPIGTWALDRACQEFAYWQRSLGTLAPSNIHVNLSRKQLLLRDLTEMVRSVLKKHEVPPQALHLEVTESEIMQNPHVAREVLAELRQLGVKIGMDDFGTGHSSLACLQELPIDVLKIDRSFINNMERSRSFAALVHAVATLGQNLGLSTVAEGIENADQLAMLQSMDCEYGQGYFFGRPMPADEVSAFLFRAARTAMGQNPARLLEETPSERAALELLRQ